MKERIIETYASIPSKMNYRAIYFIILLNK